MGWRERGDTGPHVGTPGAGEPLSPQGCDLCLSTGGSCPGVWRGCQRAAGGRLAMVGCMFILIRVMAGSCHWFLFIYLFCPWFVMELSGAIC